MENLEPNEQVKEIKQKKKFSKKNLIINFFLVYFVISYFVHYGNKSEEKSVSPNTAAEQTSGTTQEETINKIFAKNAFLGSVGKIEKLTDNIYTVTSPLRSTVLYSVLFDESGNFKEFRIYVPNVVDFPLNIAEDYTIDEAYFNNALDVEVPKIVAENPPKEDVTSTMSDEVKEKIKIQFSPWDGSHPKFIREVKKQLNNPKSFEHQETKTGWDSSTNTIIIEMTFRANNKLGQPILNTAVGTVDIEGNVLSCEIKE